MSVRAAANRTGGGRSRERRRPAARRLRDRLQLWLPFLAPGGRPAREPSARKLPRTPRESAESPDPATDSPGPAAPAPGRPESGARDALLRSLWDREAPGWSERWGVDDLRVTVRLELSHRMRSSLGGFYARQRLIRIADTLLEAPAHLLREVLCHEAAHAAVEILHGDRARSHGREWRELMRRVGLEPRVHVPGEELGRASQRAARKRWVWRHRCPQCRAERLAGRPVRQWRCRPCQAAGGDGKLVVTRVAARAVRAPGR